MPTARELLDQALTRHRAGDLAAAEPLYRGVLTIEPENPIANNDLGNLLRACGKLDRAVECYHRALRALPGSAIVLGNLGKALLEQGELAEAEQFCRRSLAADPNYVPAYDTLGSILMACGGFEEAETVYRRAIAIKPDFVESLFNLALDLRELGRPVEAEEINRRALELNPTLPEALAQQGCLRLLAGDFERRLAGLRMALANAKVAWPALLVSAAGLGWSAGAGKTILLYTEQGFGDMIQFVRYAPLVKQHCGTVMIGCPPVVANLLKSCAGVDVVVQAVELLPAFDMHAALLSLPRIFRTTLATIPASVPYLRADDELVEALAARAVRSARLQGGDLLARRSRASARSASLIFAAAFRFARQACRRASLQFATSVCGRTTGGRCRLRGHRSGGPAQRLLANRGRDHESRFGDHLRLGRGPSGRRLGRPVWVALPFVPDWRWLQQREDSPWYPTMRLFRQHQRGDWAGVFERIAVELQRLVHAA